MRLRRSLIALVVLVSILTACVRGFNFSQELRLITAAAPLLVNSLPISASAKQLVGGDFTAIANSAATFKESLDACGSNAACRVMAVETLTTSVNAVLNEGRFGSHPRLADIQRVIQGVINAARVYYGAPPAGPSIMSGQPMTKSQAEKAMKDGMKELKKLMEPIK